jgi:serine/threonine protein kinase
MSAFNSAKLPPSGSERNSERGSERGSERNSERGSERNSERGSERDTGGNGSNGSHGGNGGNGSNGSHGGNGGNGSNGGTPSLNTVLDRRDFIGRIEELLSEIGMTSMVLSVENRGDVDRRSQGDIRCLLDKKIYNFKDVIKKLGVTLDYKKSGSSGHAFKGTMCVPLPLPDGQTSGNDRANSQMGEIAIKVVAYPRNEKYGSPHDASRPENAELLILHHLSYLVMNNHTPHIILPICTFYSKIRPFISLHEQKIVEDNKRYAAFVERYNKKEYYDNVSVLISEWANKGDLLDYIRKNYKAMSETDWRVLIFQIVSTLASIHIRFPGFRHNDFKANNILLNTVGKKVKAFKYNINGDQYEVPNIGIQIKLWDFDFACIPGLVDNAKVNAEWTDLINVCPEQNRYYDIHYFFNTLRSNGFFPELLQAPEIPDSLKEFIYRVVPKRLAEGKEATRNGRLLKKIEHVLPEALIRSDPYFAPFRGTSRSVNR